MAEVDHTQDLGKSPIEDKTNHPKPPNLIEKILNRTRAQQNLSGGFKTHLWHE